MLKKTLPFYVVQYYVTFLSNSLRKKEIPQVLKKWACFSRKRLRYSYLYEFFLLNSEILLILFILKKTRNCHLFVRESSCYLWYKMFFVRKECKQKKKLKRKNDLCLSAQNLFRNFRRNRWNNSTRKIGATLSYFQRQYLTGIFFCCHKKPMN